MAIPHMTLSARWAYALRYKHYNTVVFWKFNVKPRLPSWMPSWNFGNFYFVIYNITFEKVVNSI